jgi:Arc/MetJ-type ribon-helix-helix transcriptional regulator
MKTIKVKLPEKIYSQLDILVKEGWFPSHGDIVAQALRRFLDSHRPELMEKFILEDIEWGLHGK